MSLNLSWTDRNSDDPCRESEDRSAVVQARMNLYQGGAGLGLRDLVDVLDARADLFDQRIQYVDAFRQLLLDRLNLQAAAGPLASNDMTDTMAMIQRIIGPPQDDTPLPAVAKVPS